MKTKTILIKCEVPDDFSDNGIRLYDSGSGLYFSKGSYKILTPPSDEDIERAAFDDTERAGKFERAVKWTLKRLGL